MYFGSEKYVLSQAIASFSLQDFQTLLTDENGRLCKLSEMHGFKIILICPVIVCDNLSI